MPLDRASEAWWLEPRPTPTRGASEASGLSQREAKARLARHGPNLLRQTGDRPLLWQYLARFKNPLIVILLSAGAASALVSEFVNFTIISLIVSLGVTLDFMQEYRANRAAQTLRRSVSLRATVVRDGSATTIPAAAVVPGDVALLAAGDMVPADALVLEAHDFFVQQALLTGEAYPVEKRPDAPPRTACDIAGATNAVFMGTSVVSGNARILAVRTGAHTAIGGIAGGIAAAAPPTSFETGSRRFGMLIMRLTVLMVLFVLMVNTIFTSPGSNRFCSRSRWPSA